MSFIESPSRELGDDLDGQLRAFFRSRMPHPWPSAPTPRLPSESTAPTSPRRRTLFRSRFALAASVALLLLGSLLLPGRMTQDGNANRALDAPTIGSRDLRQKMEREHKLKEFENKNKIGFGAEGDGLGMLDAPAIK